MAFQRNLRVIFSLVSIQSNLPVNHLPPTTDVPKAMYLVEGEIKREMQLRVEILVGPIATKNTPSEYTSVLDNF